MFALCSRYVKYRARVAALALDPAIQGIIYCGIFMFMPLGTALLPLFMKELVYMLWVIKEVLQIAAPGERRGLQHAGSGGWGGRRHSYWRVPCSTCQIPM